MSDDTPQQVLNRGPPQPSLFAEYKSVFSSTWKSFSYDHHENLRRLRQEGMHCAMSFLLCCTFCLACAVSLSIAESAHLHNNMGSQQLNPLEIESQILLQEKRTVDALWSASSFLQEVDWKVQARETLRMLRQESAALQSCEPTVNDAPDWSIINSFVYMLTVVTSIGYGHIFPRTNAGRALTIVYAIVGIPIFLILMADFGKLFTRLLKSLFVFVKKLYRTATCRRVRKTRAVQSVKHQQRVSPMSRPPLAVPESLSTDFDKPDEADQQAQVREREPFLTEEERRKQEQMGEDEEGEEEEKHQE
ncbi:hypothetical protein OTU49_010599, partial [Cherax quadricarinatus]